MLNSTDQDIVYSDKKFGLGTLEGLVNWVEASMNGNASVSYALIQANFALKGDLLSDATMQQICGT